MKKILVISSFLVFVAVCLCSCGSTTSNNPAVNGVNAASNSKAATPSKAPARKAEITATAETLAKEYKLDSKSSSRYEGKVVEISGKFDRSSGTSDAPEVKFETGDAVQVTCRISASAIQAAAKFEKGQDIKMTGIGDPLSIIGPLFKDCEVTP